MSRSCAGISRCRLPKCARAACLSYARRGWSDALRAGPLLNSVEIRHFNDITSENAYSDVMLVILIGRTEPSPHDLEQITRALFGCDVVEVQPDEQGEIVASMVAKGIPEATARAFVAERRGEDQAHV